MPRKRMIDPSFWTDEKLGECTIQERYLFMGLISNADDEGYGRANPKLLKSLLFPYDDGLRTSDLQKWLSRLGGFKMVVLYEVNGQAYYYLPNFIRYQTINRPTKSSIPKPEDSTHGVLTEGSLSAHGALTPNRKEENRREENKITRVRSFYENHVGMLNRHIATCLSGFLDEMEPEVVERAISIAAGKGVSNWKYINTILSSWLDKGIRAESDLKRLEHRAGKHPSDMPAWMEKLVKEAEVEER